MEYQTLHNIKLKHAKWTRNSPKSGRKCGRGVNDADRLIQVLTIFREICTPKFQKKL